MSATATLAPLSVAEYPEIPAVEILALPQALCIHADVNLEKNPAQVLYWYTCSVVERDRTGRVLGDRYDAQVITSNPCITAINKAIAKDLGPQYCAVTYRLAKAA